MSAGAPSRTSPRLESDISLANLSRPYSQRHLILQLALMTKLDTPDQCNVSWQAQALSELSRSELLIDNVSAEIRATLRILTKNGSSRAGILFELFRQRQEREQLLAQLRAGEHRLSAGMTSDRTDFVYNRPSDYHSVA